MGKLIDITGKRFGRLLVIERRPTINRKAYWSCKCDCGNTITVSASSLLCGKTRSCGCLRKEQMKLRATVHGFSGEPLYSVWNMMKQRCQNSNNKDYHFYGERGISVCDEWIRYPPFREWALKNGYLSGLTIDRIDSDGNYEASNCRWITIQEQQKNRRPRSKKEGIRLDREYCRLPKDN